MPLLDSAVSDEAAAAAQQVQDAENALLAALAEQAEAEQAVADAAETEDPADDTAAAERKAAADTAVAEAQAAYDALVPPAEGEEAQPAGEEAPAAEAGEKSLRPKVGKPRPRKNPPRNKAQIKAWYKKTAAPASRGGGLCTGETARFLMSYILHGFMGLL